MSPSTDERFAMLGRRERQLVETLHRLDTATASEIRRELSDPPSYSAVRGMLRHLESKGYVAHDRDGKRFVYRLTIPRSRSQKWAVTNLIRTFFGGSRGRAVAALLGLSDVELDHVEIERLAEMIRRARGERS